MHLEYAILGFLNYRPWTGYELKRVFDVSIRHFWPADQSQIYKTLSRLAEQGLTEVEVVHQTDRPSRKVYSITEAGREAFREWVSATPVPEEYRDPFLIQVFFSGQLTDDETIAMMEAKIEEVMALPYDRPGGPEDRVVERYAPPGEAAGTEGPYSYRVETAFVGRTLEPAASPTGQLRVDVTVTWDGGSYAAGGLVSGEPP